MAAAEYSETIGPVRFGSGGVSYIDYNLSTRNNITIKSVNCIWIGTAPSIEYHNATRWNAPIIDYGHGNIYSYQNSTGSANTGGGGNPACSTVAPISGWTPAGSASYTIVNNSGSSSGSCGSGTRLCTETPGWYYPYGQSYPGQYRWLSVSWSMLCSVLSEAGHADRVVEAGHYDVPDHPHGTAAHTHTYYSTPTKVMVGSVDAATFTQGGSLQSGISSNSYTISPALIKPGSVNRINTGAIGGNGSALFQMTVVYTLNTPTPIKYLRVVPQNGVPIRLVLVELTDPQLVTDQLRVRVLVAGTPTTLCADLMPINSSTRTDWSNVFVKMPDQVMVWRKAV